jgi:Na+-transporting methylmalonyl-CoA/oxaloacetate decarboxylase gamma subunit
MIPKKPDPLTLERIRMENIGKGFIFLVLAMLIFAGRYFFNY